MRNIISIPLALLLLVAGPAAADHDGDAPDAPADAAPLGAGVHTGTVGGADRADWHRVLAPHGHGVRVDVVIDNVGRFLLRVENESGAWKSDRFLVHPNASRASASVVASPGAVRVGILDARAPGDATEVTAAYTLTLTFERLPDYAVRAVRVVNAPLARTDAAPVHSGVHRVVEVDVENLGGPARAGFVQVRATTPTDGRSGIVGHEPLKLAPGESRTVSIPWSAVGFVGDVDLAVTAAGAGDADPANGVRTTRHYALVGGTGHGFGPGAATCATFLCMDPARAGASFGLGTPFVHGSVTGYALPLERMAYLGVGAAGADAHVAHTAGPAYLTHACARGYGASACATLPA